MSRPRRIGVSDREEDAARRRCRRSRPNARRTTGRRAAFHAASGDAGRRARPSSALLLANHGQAVVGHRGHAQPRCGSTARSAGPGALVVEQRERRLAAARAAAER